MKSRLHWPAAVAVAVLGVGLLAASASAGSPVPGSRTLARGRYLVTRAVPCADCHSPRDRAGRLIAGRDLQGAPIGFAPLHPIPGWKSLAPSIAGLPPGWSFAQTVHFLETGIMPGGGQAGPPMPAFRFDERDARAIAAYLKSLPGPGSAAH